MEKDYIKCTQKQHESYYQKVLNTQLWTPGIIGLILTGVFVLVAGYARALAKEVQKLWDSNVSNSKKLKEALTAQIADKSRKPRNLIESKIGATTLRSLQKNHAENYVEKAREELADPLYNGLEEELAIAALQIPWLTPLVNERRPAAPEPPAPEPSSEAPAPRREVLHPAADLAIDEESDSCRLIST